MSMVERVAKAICAANGIDPDEPVHGGGMEWSAWQEWEDEARAAIAEMREPTKWMRDEGMRAHMKALYTGKTSIDSGIDDGLKAVDLIWPAMLDAALK
jgi:hypothetical protein